MKFKLTKQYFKTDANMQLISCGFESECMKEVEDKFEEYVNSRLNNPNSNVEKVIFEVIFEKGV